MCEVNWVLLSGIIASLASAANALLLVWMIRVTIRYVETNRSLFEVNRESLNELRKQYANLKEREVRPYKNLISRVLRTLENQKARDLVSEFENRNGIGWLSPGELLPSDYEDLLKKSMSYDVVLFESLHSAKEGLVAQPMRVVSEMQTLARSNRSTLYPELPQLQAEFRSTLSPIVEQFRAIQEKLSAEHPT